MLEKTLEATCCKYIKQHLGWNNIKVKTPDYPDRMFFKGGKYFWVEFKAEWGKLSKMQEFRIGELEKTGEKIFVINTKNKFITEVCEYARTIEARSLSNESD